MVSKNYTARDWERGESREPGRRDKDEKRRTETEAGEGGKQDESWMDVKEIQRWWGERERWQAYNMFYELKDCGSISLSP